MDSAGGDVTVLISSAGKERERTNADGTTTELRYFRDGRLREERGPGLKTIIRYDDASRTVRKQRVAKVGNALSADFSTASTDPAPTVIVTNSRGQTIRSADSAGFSVVTQYDHLGRPLSVSQPDASTSGGLIATRFVYDATGIEMRAYNGSETGYDQETLSTTDDLGRPKSSKIFARPTSEGVPASLLRQSRNEYSPNHRRVTTILGGAGENDPVLTSWIYSDNVGKPLISMAADGTRTVNGYDLNGNVTAVTVFGGPGTTGIQSSGLTTKMEYDALGRLVKTTKPDNTQVTTTYTARYTGTGRDGWTVQSVMPGGMVEHRQTDKANKTMLTKLDGSGAGGDKRTYEYTYYPLSAGAEAGLLASFTQQIDHGGTSLRTHSYSYDSLLRIEEYTIGSYGSADYIQRTYAYDGTSGRDSGRNLVVSLKETNHYGAETTVNRDYDSHGRMLREWIVNSGYDTIRDVRMSYDPDTQRRISLARAVDGVAAYPAYGFAYEADGKLKEVTFDPGEDEGDEKTFSYVYDEKGQIRSRTSPWRVNQVTSRDSRGRLLSAQTDLPGISTRILTESITWTSDSRQESYTAQRGLVGSNLGVFNDARLYAYDPQSRRLTGEDFNPHMAGIQGMTYSYDSTANAGTGSSGQGSRGILTSQIQTAGHGAGEEPFATTVQAGDVDAWSRVGVESQNDVRRFVPLTGVSANSSDVALSFFGEVPYLRVRRTSSDWSSWKAPLRLRPSAEPYQVVARAQASSPAANPQTVSSPHSFEVARRAPQEVIQEFNAEGQITKRTFADGRVQLLSWDGAGRLSEVTEYRNHTPDSSDPEASHAYVWRAFYDGLNRRLYTDVSWGTYQPSTGAFSPSLVAPGGMSEYVAEETWYDPGVEFLEIAVQIKRTGHSSRAFTWMVHGVDANGAYGSLQGLGGLEATYTHEEGETADGTWTGIIDDDYGHVVAIVKDGTLSSESVQWQRTRSIGYGPAPDSPVFSLAEGANVGQATAWRGKRQDITGFYWMGARYYDPAGGRFLSPDPLGHAESMTLYDYAGGDPINFVDPTGRGKKYDPNDPNSWTLPDDSLGFWSPDSTGRGQGTFMFYETTSQHSIFNGSLPYKQGVPDFKNHIITVEVNGIKIPGQVNVELSTRSKDASSTFKELSAQYGVPAAEIRKAFNETGDVNIHHFSMDGTMQIVPASVNGGIDHSGPASAMKNGWDFKEGKWKTAGKVAGAIGIVGYASAAQSAAEGDYGTAVMEATEETVSTPFLEGFFLFMDWGPKRSNYSMLSEQAALKAANIFKETALDPSKPFHERQAALAKVKDMMGPGAEMIGFDGHLFFTSAGLTPIYGESNLDQIDRAFNTVNPVDKNPSSRSLF
ncbi:MAG TPA: hypothetical protein DCP71_14330 [Verrucomicrobiales bacterium]|nr:hypothetical protein [Verrucomicrobiales bacterium]